MSVTNYGGQRDNVGIIPGGSPDTGEMRRKYNFAEQFTELSIDQTPFFRLVSKIGNKPTDDPNFKFTEKRQSWMKRYGYCIAASAAVSTGPDDATLALDGQLAASDVALYMAADYLSQGNIQNIIGQTGVAMGGVGTRPEFYLPGQVIKVNYSLTTGGAFSDFALYRVSSLKKGFLCHTDDANAGTPADAVVGGFYEATTLDSGYDAANFYEVVELVVAEVKAPVASHLMSYASNALVTDVAPNSDQTNRIAQDLEIKRSYVVGTAHSEGSALIEANWADQPYSTGQGYTQIFRSEFGMSNTARATALKYEKNEWARLWRDKLIEHKWEIEQTALFGKAAAGATQYTQGGVDYILSNGNLFNLTHSSKTADSFLEDLSMLVDPRYNNSKKMVFFCDTATYNWLHKLGGYFQNNMEQSPNFSSNFASTGKKKVFGVDFTTISTVYGDINVARNIHLDGSGVKIMGVNMNYVKWRPLVGNGVNRDTSVYVGVQTLENTGTDKRVDMILTEGGFEWSMPECHAIWK